MEELEWEGGHWMSEELATALAQVPGLVLAVSHAGERSYSAYGNRQIFGVVHPKEMHAETAFDLGSITKIIATTSALMVLQDKQEFSLEDKVSRYIPQWSRNEKEEITIKDLLLHRSGLWEWRPLYIEDQDSSKVQDRLAAIPLRYGVNTQRHYSDLGFIALGQVLQAITKEELSMSVSKLVLEPLGMRETRFSHPIASFDVAATSFGDSIEREMVKSKFPYPVPEDVSHFRKWREEILVGDVNDGNSFHIFGGVSSHAGLFSTATDLLRYGESILSSLAGEGYFSQSILENFLSTGPDVGQALGFRSWLDEAPGCPAQFFGHTGFPGTVLAISSKHRFVAVLLTNRLHVAEKPVPTEELWRPILAGLHAQLHQ
jgi:CubicO group peptidase (beta-lactamase class C family)